MLTSCVGNEASLVSTSHRKQSPTVEETVRDGNISIEIKDVDTEADRTDADEKQGAIDAFLGFLKLQGKETQPLRVARALAEGSLERLHAGKVLVAYNSVNVAGMAGHNVPPDRATGWLTRNWTTLEKRLEEWEPGIQEFARQAGLSIYARPRKYWLAQVALETTPRMTSNFSTFPRRMPSRLHRHRAVSLTCQT